MRHAKHRHGLGVKKEHRFALMAHLAQAILIHGKIETTLAKAKALRPFIEKIITLAKKADGVEDRAQKLHYRRLALRKVRDRKSVKKLFEERVKEFSERQGGYTRIYKLWNRLGDAAEMAIIELVAANDEGYKKQSKSTSKARKSPVSNSKPSKASPRNSLKTNASKSESTVPQNTNQRNAEALENV